MPAVVITTPGSGSWTVPPGATSVDVECWGGGGAGPYGAAGGGGGWSADTLAVTPGQALNYYIAPTQPYSGTGAKTVGQDTWFGSLTTILAKGADGHLGGQASAGYGAQKFSGGSARFIDPSTGQPAGLSDSTYGVSGASASKAGNGGDGLYNPQTAAGSGGESPGAGAAGQSNVEGGGGAVGAEQGGTPGGGSRASTSTRGQIRLSWDVTPVELPFPVVQSTSQGVRNADAPLSLPAGVEPGDLILILLSIEYATSVATPQGYTLIGSALADGEYAGGHAAFYKIATGADACSFPIQVGYLAYRISGAGVPTGTFGKSHVPPTHTAPAANNLWLASTSLDSNTIDAVAPPGYTDLIQVNGTPYRSLASARRARNTGSESPAADMEGGPRTSTIVVPPASGTVDPPGDTTAPTITSASSASVAENTVNPTGVLSASEAVTWTIAGGADAALFSVSGSNCTLNGTPDFEQKSSYAVTWRATDAAGNASTQAFTLQITDVDETPPPVGGSPWTPDDLDRKILWIDCSDTSTLTFGGYPNVSRYADKSSAGRDLTVEQPPSYVASGLNGLAASYWYQDRMAFTAIAAGTALTAFFAVQGETPQTLMTLVGNTSNFLAPIAASNSASNTEVFRGMTAPTIRKNGSAATWSNRGDAHAALTDPATQVLVWRNFTTQAALDRFGAGPFSYYFRGLIGEVIFVQGDPSQTDLERVEGYLAHKWGTAGALPASHPFKSAPPTVGAPTPARRAPRFFQWL